jgi:hypothetical protein
MGIYVPDLACHSKKGRAVMLLDILIAVLIVVVAAILGIVVHPLLWILVIVAALWLFGRRRVSRV